MKFLSVTEFAEKWDLTARRVRQLCAEGKIEGAFLVGKTYNIPEDAQKPADRRSAAIKTNTKVTANKTETGVTATKTDTEAIDN